jgi:hypothetical protein
MTKLSVGLDNERIRYRATTGKPMYSKKQFAALEAMCREQAALARKEILADGILACRSRGMEATQGISWTILRKNCESEQ